MSLASDYKREQTELCRRLILDALAAVPGYAITHTVLRGLLADRRFSAAEVNADLAWLEERGLIRNRMLGDSMPEAVITTMGEDVAAGRGIVEGVRNQVVG